MVTLSYLYNRFDGPVPKYLLEQARTGKTAVDLAIITWRRQARWNMVKSRDWERTARFADMSKRADAPARAVMYRGDARFHRACARRQYHNAERLEAQERDAQERAA